MTPLEGVGAVGGALAAPPAPATQAAPGTAAAAAGRDQAPAKQAEGFERVLLGQLTRTLIDSALGADDATSAATTAYKDLLPDALTEALMSGGGIGLAKILEEPS